MNTLTAGQAAVMRMEPGWLPYRRKPGKPLASTVRPGNYFVTGRK